MTDAGEEKYETGCKYPRCSCTVIVGGFDLKLSPCPRVLARTSPKGASSSLHDGTDRDSRKENAK